MKKIYLSLLFFTFPLLFCAQPYFNDGATWFYGHYPWVQNAYVKIEKTGEVWMSGKFCDELKFSWFNYNNAGSDTMHVNYHYTYGNADSVLIHQPQNGTFGILYDFTQTTGGWLSCAICTSPFLVDSISQTTIGSAVLRTQHTSMNNFSFRTIEKIGNTGFFIPHMDMWNPSAPGLNLRCYQDNEGLYLRTGITETCDEGNPLHDQTTIQVTSGPFAISVISNSIVPGSEITIYDVCGRLVVREYATQATTCYIEMQLDARAVYFATVRNDEEYISEKFLLLNPE
ncbi:MAG TPA: T9SS type A sorting domain-containing protein [Bacteroidia bacterium]|nr:T9SS type A sorting domain-containing protein [Bacteroidia bacterium]